MSLHKFDEIQIDGIHPRHPITDREITDYLQSFLVTRDEDGETIDPATLYPRCVEHSPIPMTRVRTINGRLTPRTR